MSTCENAKLFEKSHLPVRTSLGAMTPFDDSLLRARGFDERGNRIGGISAPVQVTVPTGTMLVRTFGGDAQAVGQWWFTLHELSEVLNYVGHTDVAEGRQAGKGVLHAFLAVLQREWKSTCEFFALVELQKSVYAFHGEGGHVAYGGAGGQKAARIISRGSQRGVRQIMLPKLWEYQSAVVYRISKGSTDRELVAVCRRLPAQPLPFEA